MEIRSIGMGFSIFGQFAGTFKALLACLVVTHSHLLGSLVLLQTAPIGFEQVGWKYYLVLICSIAVFIPCEQSLYLRYYFSHH